MTKYNIWFFGSLIVAAVVAMPIITVFLAIFLTKQVIIFIY